MKQKYDWQRRWYARNITTPFDVASTNTADRFLATWQLQTFRQGILFNDIKYVPCLILLGEPGQGKSFFVRSEFEKITIELNSTPNEAMLFDLQGSNSPQYIYDRVFSDNPIYLKWKSGTHHLTIFLDSVDRTQIAVEDVITVLVNEFLRVDVSRLSLRLVCRDYDWSFTLASALTDIWNDRTTINADIPSVQVYQLAPLGFNDIAHAATMKNISVEKFFKNIQQMDAMPLATLPITLEMLLDRYPSIAASRVELYQDAMISLCRTGNTDDQFFSTKANTRFGMASRIATIMLLANKYSVAIGVIDTNEDTSVVSISELLLDKASESEERLLADTLNTSLFRGTQYRQWAHQSFAEFLAAYHLSEFNIPLKEILDKVMIDNVFAPQLHEMIRWLALLRDDVFREVIKRQPAILLSTDLSHISERDFRKLLSKLLSLDDEYVYIQLHNDLREQQIRIHHPSLEKLLLPYLNNSSLSNYLRRFVIGLIDRFGLMGFDEQLLFIINNNEEDKVLRNLAADALWNVGSVDSKKALKPYIYGVSDDIDDELKGYALLSLWSEHLTSEELFDVLVQPKKESYFGSYSSFLSGDRIVSGLTVSDLPIALRWVAKQPEHHKMDLALVRVAHQIMTKSWDSLKSPEVLYEFSKTAYILSMQHDNIFFEGGVNWRNRQEVGEYTLRFFNDINSRRSLVLAMLPQIVQKQTPDYFLTGGSLPYLFRDDLDWVLQQLSNTHDLETQTVWANVISRLLRSMTGHNLIKQNLAAIDKIYTASERNSTLNSLVEKFFLSRFGDAETESAKKNYYENKNWANKHKIEPPDPLPIERIEDALHKIENGGIFQWMNVVKALRLSSDGSRVFSNIYDFNIEEFPSWEQCSQNVKQRIVDAAKLFVLQQEEYEVKAEDDDWYITGEIPYTELHGYLAIFLILRHDFDFLISLPKGRWLRWSKILVWFPFKTAFQMDREEQDRRLLEYQNILFCFAYNEMSHRMITDLLEIINADDKKYQSIHSQIYKFDKCFDVTLENALLSKVQDSTLSIMSRQNLIDFLLQHNSKDATIYAESVIESGYLNENEKELMIRFCVSLMNYSQNIKWSVVWGVILSDVTLGKALIERVAAADHRRNYLAQKLNAQELADLFIWVEKQYPSDEDPDIDGLHTVTNREQVGNWRNGLITALRSVNDPQVLSEIRRLTDHFPDLHWLQFVRVDVEKATLGTRWQPSAPSDLLSVFGTKHVDRQLLKLLVNLREWFLQDIRWLIAIIITVMAMMIPIFQNEIRIALGLDQLPIPTPSIELTDVLEPTVVTTLQPVEETEEFLIPEVTETDIPSNTP